MMYRATHPRTGSVQLWTMANTDGYTQAELDEINDAWQQLVDAEGWEEGTDEYEQRATWFSWEVSRR